MHHCGGVSVIQLSYLNVSSMLGNNISHQVLNNNPRYGQTECVAPCTLTAPGDPQPDHVRIDNVDHHFD